MGQAAVVHDPGAASIGLVEVPLDTLDGVDWAFRHGPPDAELAVLKIETVKVRRAHAMPEPCAGLRRTFALDSRARGPSVIRARAPGESLRARRGMPDAEEEDDPAGRSRWPGGAKAIPFPTPHHSTVT